MTSAASVTPIRRLVQRIVLPLLGRYVRALVEVNPGERAAASYAETVPRANEPWGDVGIFYGASRASVISV
jgi:hypothetical protein